MLQVYGEEVDDLVSTEPAILDTLCPLGALRAWLSRLLCLGTSTPEFADT